jgi:hypothetical protein
MFEDEVTHITFSSYFYIMKHKSIALIFILSISALSVQAQQVFNSQENKRKSSYHIKALKEGVLLVRLPSNRKKIEALEKTLVENLSEKEYKNVSKTLARTLSETEELHDGIIDAMESAYTFSEYAFFMDYDTHEVLERNGKLYQSDMKTAFELNNTAPVYVMSVGRTPENSINAFLIMDNTLQNMSQPFPASISRSGLMSLFSNDTTHIKRLNAKLWRYFLSLTES